MARRLLVVLFVSMLPIVELRGAIPIGAAMDIPFWENYIVAVLGNILPVPFLIMFAKKILVAFSSLPKIGGAFRRIIEKADEKAHKIGKWELIGLFLFVAIPAPGTGAWTGSLISAMLRLRLVPSLIAISLGVAVSGIIIGVLSFGVFSLI